MTEAKASKVTAEDIAVAEKWCKDEIRRLHFAPALNGCGMTKEWEEQLRVMMTMLCLCEAAKERQ